MTTANIYLTFQGTCEEAFEFYKSVLGGAYDNVSRFKEMPPQEGMPPMPPELGDKLMHISLRFGETVIMGSDSGGGWGPDITAGNNFSISLNADSKEEADRLFAGLSAGGTVTMPMGDTFWGSYFGMFTDKFGVGWMVSFGTGEQS
ncbi:VOC family protein [bacterium]|nr:VOC family protein [bacterium]